uniref:HDC00628 n=1 Tax=Drosophila melanogaster TaxID=7227 RepID=Q6IHW6_DROME|nr:TPA_inf: HDC00628 [Drosophila melanogaster]
MGDQKGIIRGAQNGQMQTHHRPAFIPRASCTNGLIGHSNLGSPNRDETQKHTDSQECSAAGKWDNSQTDCCSASACGYHIHGHIHVRIPAPKPRPAGIRAT